MHATQGRPAGALNKWWSWCFVMAMLRFVSVSGNLYCPNIFVTMQLKINRTNRKSEYFYIY